LPPADRARAASTARRKGVASLLGAGADCAAQLRPRGTGCSPANGVTPEELLGRPGSFPCVFTGFTAPVSHYDLRTVRPPKSLGFASALSEPSPHHIYYGRPPAPLVALTSRRIVGRRRATRHTPLRWLGGEHRPMTLRRRPPTPVLTYCVYGTSRGCCDTPWGP